MSRRHPFLYYAVLFFGLTLVGTFLLWFLARLDIVAAWFVAITLVTLLAYRFDKNIAGSARLRVPERILLVLVFAGGSLGAILGMYFVGRHHKTNKPGFMLPFYGILIVQVIIASIYLASRFSSV